MTGCTARALGIAGFRPIPALSRSAATSATAAVAKAVGAEAARDAQRDQGAGRDREDEPLQQRLPVDDGGDPREAPEGDAREPAGRRTPTRPASPRRAARAAADRRPRAPRRPGPGRPRARCPRRVVAAAPSGAAPVRSSSPQPASTAMQRTNTTTSRAFWDTSNPGSAVTSPKSGGTPMLMASAAAPRTAMPTALGPRAHERRPDQDERERPDVGGVPGEQPPELERRARRPAPPVVQEEAEQVARRACACRRRTIAPDTSPECADAARPGAGASAPPARRRARPRPRRRRRGAPPSAPARLAAVGARAGAGRGSSRSPRPRGSSTRGGRRGTGARPPPRDRRR